VGADHVGAVKRGVKLGRKSRSMVLRRLGLLKSLRASRHDLGSRKSFLRKLAGERSEIAPRACGRALRRASRRRHDPHPRAQAPSRRLNDLVPYFFDRSLNPPKTLLLAGPVLCYTERTRTPDGSGSWGTESRMTRKLFGTDGIRGLANISP